MRLSCIFFLILWICFPQRGWVQACLVQTYQPKMKGSPGSFRGTFQDKEGYLWIGGLDGGASRFDGRDWVNFSDENGLKSNRCLDIWQDPTGRMWFFHDDNTLSSLFNGKFQQFTFSSSVKAVTSGGNILVVDPGTRSISRVDPATGREIPCGVQLPGDSLWRTTTSLISNDHDLEGLVIRQEQSKTREVAFFQYTSGKWKQLPNNLPAGIKLQDLGMSGILNHPIFTPAVKPGYDPNKVLIYRNNRWETLPVPSYRLSTGADVYPQGGFKGCSIDRVHQKAFILWKFDELPGLYPRYLIAEYDASFNLLSTCLFATPEGPSGVIKDRAGTYWVASGPALLRVFPTFLNIANSKLNLLSGIFGIAQAPDGKIWFGSHTTGWAYFDDLNVYHEPALWDQFPSCDLGSLEDSRTGAMYFNVQKYPGTENGLDGLLRFDGKKKVEVFNKGTRAVHLSYDKKGQLMRGTLGKGLWILPNGADIGDDNAWKKIDGSKGLQINRIFTALQDRHGRYWMGGWNKGIACYDPSRDAAWNWTKQTRPDNYAAYGIAEDGYGNLWFGTDKGLCFLKLPPVIDSTFDLFANLKRVALEQVGESTMGVCRLYDDHTLLLCNEKGFFFFDLDAYYKGSLAVYSFLEMNSQALNAGGLNGAWTDHEKRIWLCGSGGATCFNPALWVRDTSGAPAVRIDSALIGNKTFYRFSNEIEGNGPAGLVRIWVGHGMNPQLYDNIHVYYRLSGDTSWRAMNRSNIFEAPNLASGHYVFEVLAERDGMRSRPATLRFYVTPPWWQNPLFWLSVLGIVIAGGMFFIHQYRKMNDQQIQIARDHLDMEKLSREKTQLQVQAVVNQLNPHFINNALQWLQVRVDEDEEAVRVVGKLSENISTVFKNSRQKKPYHSLVQEMNLTENYLYIQKCRFGRRLEYSMPPAALLTANEQINVLLMMVQIHAENAVEHGVRNKSDGTGKVEIELREEPDYVVISVTDNGVGREAAKKIGSKGTQNGTKMLQELETIYNTQNQYHLEQFYEDNLFTLPDGTQYGTRVVIRIPKKYNFEL